MLRILFAITTVLFVSACSSVQVSNYSKLHPEFVAESFFDGDLVAHGVVKNRGGKVIRTFSADIKAYWKNGVGTLEEDFVFDDGEDQRRVWTLTPSGDNQYIGTAGDVVGEGIMTVAGNSAFLNYVLRIPYGDGTIDVKVEDRMYLTPQQVLISESDLSKWGFHAGELLLTIVKTGS